MGDLSRIHVYLDIIRFLFFKQRQKVVLCTWLWVGIVYRVDLAVASGSLLQAQVDFGMLPEETAGNRYLRRFLPASECIFICGNIYLRSSQANLHAPVLQWSAMNYWKTFNFKKLLFHQPKFNVSSGEDTEKINLWLKH